MSSAAAARILGLNARQVRRQVHAGLLPGGAEPKPKCPRYYVYSDVPPLGGHATGTFTAADDADLRARVDALETANLLLLAGEAYLRQAADAATRVAELLREAERERAREASALRLADAAKADAISALLVPGTSRGL